MSEELHLQLAKAERERDDIKDFTDAYLKRIKELEEALQTISKKVQTIKDTFIHISLIEKTKFFELGEIAEKALSGERESSNEEALKDEGNSLKLMKNDSFEH